MFVVIRDNEKEKEEKLELPRIENSFPYLNHIDIQKRELYNDFPEGLNRIATLGGMPIASGGEIITTADGRVFSRNVYLRFDSSHEPIPHLNVNVRDMDETTGRTCEHKLGDLHLIPIENDRKTVFVSLNEPETGESIIQPITIVPEKDYNLVKKQQEFVEKLKNGTLTEDDEKELKNLIENNDKSDPMFAFTCPKCKGKWILESSWRKKIEEKGYFECNCKNKISCEEIVVENI